MTSTRRPGGRPRAASWVKGAIALLVGSALLLLEAWQGQDLSGYAILVSFAVVSGWLLWLRPREVIAWLLLGDAIAFTIVGSAVPGSASQVTDGQGDTAITILAWLNSWAAGLFFGSFAAIAVLFPTGRFPSGRLGLGARVAVTLPLVVAAALAFAPTASVNFADQTAATVRLPLAIAPDWSGWPVLANANYIVVLGSLAVGISILLLRFRRAHGSERAQLKWLIAALGAVLGTVVFAFAMILLVDPVGSWMWIPAVVAYPMIPISIGLAIRRYHLYDIDRIVSRTISYVVITSLLAAVFGALVVALQAILSGLTHNGTGTVAIAASTLAAFVLFQPLRRRVQATIDRRFDRGAVDAQRTVDHFVDRLRGQLELAALRGALAESARDAVRPTALEVWLRVNGSER